METIAYIPQEVHEIQYRPKHIDWDTIERVEQKGHRVFIYPTEECIKEYLKSHPNTDREHVFFVHIITVDEYRLWQGGLIEAAMRSSDAMNTLERLHPGLLEKILLRRKQIADIMNKYLHK